MNIISRKDAKSLGLTLYFTNMPCPHGHIASRYVSTAGCVECINENQLKNGSANSKKYRNSNKKAIRKQNKNWRNSNPDKMKLFHQNQYNKSKKWYKQYYNAHRELYSIRGKAYRDANAYKVTFWMSKRRAMLKNATPLWYTMERSDILELYKHSNLLSESTGVLHQVDHIIPLSHNLVCGLHCKDNLRVITATENLTKSNKFVID